MYIVQNKHHFPTLTTQNTAMAFTCIYILYPAVLFVAQMAIYM